MIQIDQGDLRIYNDPSIVSGGTSAITPTERVTILGNGRIGINDSTPNDYEVDIMKRSTATDAQIRLYNNATGSSNDTIMRFQIGGTSAGNYIYFGDSADTNVGMIRYSHSDDSLRFTVNTEERLLITSAGKVGINSTAPKTRLDVVESSASRTWTPGSSVVSMFERNGNSRIAIVGGSSAYCEIDFGDTTDDNAGYIPVSYTHLRAHET